jgi:hypothetical protein
MEEVCVSCSSLSKLFGIWPGNDISFV